MQIFGNKNILIIQPLVSIGDMIWHKPWIDQLIEKNENVVLAVKKTSFSHVLFKDKLGPNNFLFIDKNLRGVKGRHDGLKGKINLIKDIKKLNLSKSLILHHSQSYYWMCKLAGIRDIGGFGYGKNNYSTLQLKKSDRQMHTLQRMPKFWELNGWAAPTNGWNITLTDKMSINSLSWLKSNNLTPNKFIILGIGAMHQERVWNYSNFVELIKKIRIKRPDITPVIMGGKNEINIAKKIQNSLDFPVKEIFVDFDIALGILQFSQGYVGNDTSLLNICGVFNKPSLGLFSLTKPLDYVPSIHSLNLIDDEEYGKIGIINKYKASDVFHWINQRF